MFKKLSPFLIPRVIGLRALFFLFNSCLGLGEDQIHGMVNLNFSATAVCNSQTQIIPFQNTAKEETVIEGIVTSGGTDRLGNFKVVSITVGTEEFPSTNGNLFDIHIQPGQDYSLKISHSPKLTNETQTAVLDIVYKAPKQGVFQVALQGTSAGRSPDCPLPAGAGSDPDDSGGPGEEDPDDVDPGDVDPGDDTETDPIPYTLKVTLMVAALNSITVPINTTQGKTPFNPPSIPVLLDAKDGKNGVVIVPPYTGQFVLPAPLDSVKPIGKMIHGPINIQMPSGDSGNTKYNASTGAINIPEILIKMDGVDFSADLKIGLTTGRVGRTSVSPLISDGTLVSFGDPSHYDPIGDEIFGMPITGEKIFLVGIARLSNVVTKEGIDSTLKGGLQSKPTMAVLIEGTLTKD